MLNDSPPPGTFLTQINVGSDNADIVGGSGAVDAYFN